MPSSLISRRWSPLALGVFVAAMLTLPMVLGSTNSDFAILQWMFFMPVGYVVAAIGDVMHLPLVDTDTGIILGAFLIYVLAFVPTFYLMFSSHPKKRLWGRIIFGVLSIYCFLAAWEGLNTALSFKITKVGL